MLLIHSPCRVANAWSVSRIAGLAHLPPHPSPLRRTGVVPLARASRALRSHTSPAKHRACTTTTIPRCRPADDASDGEGGRGRFGQKEARRQLDRAGHDGTPAASARPSRRGGQRCKGARRMRVEPARPGVCVSAEAGPALRPCLQPVGAKVLWSCRSAGIGSPQLAPSTCPLPRGALYLSQAPLTCLSPTIRRRADEASGSAASSKLSPFGV